MCVVYLYIPTSNHNSFAKYFGFEYVVYLYIPTSNHNPGINTLDRHRLYIFIFLHQTTTYHKIVNDFYRLYIFIFLHQTTTYPFKDYILVGCISLYSYIKPQPCQHSSAFANGCISLYSYIKPQRFLFLCC